MTAGRGAAAQHGFQDGGLVLAEAAGQRGSGPAAAIAAGLLGFRAELAFTMASTVFRGGRADWSFRQSPGRTAIVSETEERVAGAGSTSDAPHLGAAPDASHALETRLMAIEQAARFHGSDLDREALRFPRGEGPSTIILVQWLRDCGLWAKAVHLRWAQLQKIETAAPIVLLLNDGSAALLMTVDAARNIVWVKNPRGASGDLPVAVDELRLSQVWSGEALMIRAERGTSDDNAPFTIGWLARLVWLDKKTLKDVVYASLAISVLTIVPPLGDAGAEQDPDVRQLFDARPRVAVPGRRLVLRGRPDVRPPPDDPDRRRTRGRQA